MTLPELVGNRTPGLNHSSSPHQWLLLTPRTLLFMQFFRSMEPSWNSAEFIEALAAAGLDSVLLETLPEAILAPLQESIVYCQAEPPTSWNKGLLALVGREDVNMLLTPGQRPRNSHVTLLVSSSEINTTTNIFNNLGPFA